MSGKPWACSFIDRLHVDIKYFDAFYASLTNGLQKNLKEGRTVHGTHSSNQAGIFSSNLDMDLKRDSLTIGQTQPLLEVTHVRIKTMPWNPGRVLVPVQTIEYRVAYSNRRRAALVSIVGKLGTCGNAAYLIET